MEEKEIQLRSDTVYEMMSHPPNWLMRWGSTLIVLCLSGLVLLSAFIRYPDIISGEAKITTENPPLHITSYSSGKIVSILKKEGEEVKPGQQIVLLENPTDENQITALKKYLEETHRLLSLPNNATHYPLPNAAFLIGDLQSELNALTTSLSEINTLATDSYYTTRIQNLEKQIDHYQTLVGLNEKQQHLFKKIADNAFVKYAAQKQLFEQGAIAKLDFLKEEDQYAHVQNQLQESEKTRIQNQITLTDYEKQRNEQQFDRENKGHQQQLNARQHISNLQNQLLNWQRNYTIQATKAGHVSFLRLLSVGEFVKQGEELLVIVPKEQSFVAQLHLPAQNTGKIKEGQLVNMKLTNFPYTEFGQLTGIVQSVSMMADEKGNYRVAVSLPNKLTTSYKKAIPYQPEMVGTADIITENLSVLQRVFFQFRKLVEGN